MNQEVDEERGARGVIMEQERKGKRGRGMFGGNGEEGIRVRQKRDQDEGC